MKTTVLEYSYHCNVVCAASFVVGLQPGNSDVTEDHRLGIFRNIGLQIAELTGFFVCCGSPIQGNLILLKSTVPQ